MTGESARHDWEVAAAADAWLSEPRDTVVYARLVAAIERRRAFLNPTLPQPDPVDAPEVLDEVGSDRPPETVGSLLGTDPRAALARLREQA